MSGYIIFLETPASSYIIAGCVAAIIIVLVLAIIVVGFLVLHNKKQKENRISRKQLEQQFQTELLQTEFEVQEQTRKNLAADLHDNIGQLLSLTSVTAGSINLEDKDKATQKLSDINALLNRSIKELRQLSKIIHGEQLIQQGLKETIDQEIAWLMRNGFYTAKFTHDIEALENNDPDKDLFLYRLLQESLSNIVKHSGADNIRIGLVYGEGRMSLTISDNGVGFEVDEKSKNSHGLGLMNMKKRVDLLGGGIKIHSIPNRGTTIHIEIPYP